MATILPEIEKIVRRYIALIQKERRVSKAYLYGSFAKGIAGEWSDIDLAIVSPDFSQDLFEERVLLMKLALDIDERIEPNPFRPEDFKQENPLVAEISVSGIEVRIS